jgi:hypothetical protein
MANQTGHKNPLNQFFYRVNLTKLTRNFWFVHKWTQKSWFDQKTTKKQNHSKNID